VALIDLCESSEMVAQLFEDWRAYGDRAPSVPASWALLGLMPVRDQALPLAKALLSEVEPPAPRGRGALEAFVAAAGGRTA
jgi:hypothetical protein